MKLILCPDSFKGCLPAREVARELSSAIRELHPGWETVELPLADGGEGTLDALVPALGGQLCGTMVSDPLGRQVEAAYGLCGQTAVIEVAEACGLWRLSPSERHPLVTTSRGVAELLLAARAEGARSFLIGLGGTATCDGGAGMLEVPGLREELAGCSFELLCDVDNPLLGAEGAARVFAPQKGASPGEVEVLERRLAALAERLLAETGTDVRHLPGAGAAGGLGGMLMACFGARRSSGIDRILEIIEFDRKVAGADLIITGEGKSDAQTLHGKVPLGVLRHAGGIPVVLMSGQIEHSEDLLSAGFRALIPVTPAEMPLDEALRPETARMNLRRAVNISISHD